MAKKRDHSTAAQPHLPPILIPKSIPADQLFLDPSNPRLAEAGLTVRDQSRILKLLWEERAVNEIVTSIAASGYWPQEVLFAVQEVGKLIVVEGNRRLSAVKLLSSPDLRREIGATGIPGLSKEHLASIKELPVVVCDSRESLWKYVGFKHVNGPQDWDSIAKAEYIFRVHREYDVPLEEIASTIGDDNATVKRLYRGLTVLQQAEKAGVFDRKDSWKKKFPYSHLWTGLGYTGIQQFLDIKADDWANPDPVPKKRTPQLAELCLWLFGSREKDIRPVVMSQNPDLRALDETLRSSNGYAALRAKLPLQIALKASRGDKALLREAMILAEQTLKEARGYIPTGYEGEPDLLEKAAMMNKLVRSIQEEMAEMTVRLAKGKGHAR